VPLNLEEKWIGSNFSDIKKYFCDYRSRNVIDETLQQTFSTPGAKPTITNYNASAVKIYNADNSMARF
jgi:hypothetical protein